MEFKVEYGQLVSHPTQHGSYVTSGWRTLIVDADDKFDAYCVAYNHLMRLGYRVFGVAYLSPLDSVEFAEVVKRGIPKNARDGGRDGDMQIGRIEPYHVETRGKVLQRLEQP